MKKFTAILLILAVFSAPSFCTEAKNDSGEIQSVLLSFKYKENDAYRILSTVDEIVKVNNVPSHRAQIVNRISMKITSVNEDGSAVHEATFMTTENSTASTTERKFTWGEEYESKFTRDKNGIYTISDEYFMPVVRDVPYFPDKEVKPGDVWTAQGHEAHDLRRSFDIQTPFKVPFTASYEYLRDEEGVSSDSSKTPKTFQVISARYSIFFENPPTEIASYTDIPVATMGYSNQTIWWDNEKGQIDHYKEDFRILITTSFGNTFDFTGTAHAEVTEFERAATEENVQDVMQKVEDLGIDDISVKKTEKGLTISVENIQFEANSAILRDTEKEKLRKIAAILAEYPDNDLLVSGHTARSGTEESCQILSEERAEAVADFLVTLNVKDKYHIFTQGFGSKVPIASNITERGKAKNRRVEITILDE